jgi:hypothetical protein
MLRKLAAPNTALLRGMLRGVQPTLRQAQGRLWVRAAFFNPFLALDFFRFDGESTLRPSADNASRWAA